MRNLNKNSKNVYSRYNFISMKGDSNVFTKNKLEMDKRLKATSSSSSSSSYEM